MKNIVITIQIMLLVSFLTSCKKDLLNKEPLASSVDANFYQTEEEMERAVTAVYDPLTWESSGNTNIVFFNFFYGDIASDDAFVGGNGAEGRFLRIGEFTVDPTDEGLGEVWRKLYIGIYRANIVISKAPLSQTSQSFKDRVIGEAKFLRAYYYFQLIRMFGDVPLVTSLLSTSEYNRAKSSKAEVYTQIENDLKDAIAALPLRDALPIGKANKGAAGGLLSRVYLFQGKWAELLPVAQQVINSGVYSLMPNYIDVHALNHENNSESLFELQASTGGTGEERQNEGTFLNKFIAPRDQLVGGFGVNIPSNELVAEFSADSALWGKMDPRFKATIISDGDTVRGTVISSLTPGTSTPRVAGIRHYTRKYVDVINAEIVSFQTNGPANQRIIRYADVLLMAAEASFNLGDEAGARESVNKVRRRVQMPELDGTYSGQKLRDAIWKERRLELAMEGLRFFDIVRQGRAAQLIRATAEGKLFTAGKNEVFPIPQTEVDLSGGSLVQNPNY